jgi:hypothetical protein
MARARPVTEHEWASGDCRRMVVHARRVGTDRQIRLLLCGFLRLHAGLLPNDMCRRAVELAEGYAERVLPYSRVLAMRTELEAAEWPVGDLMDCLDQVLEPRLGLAVCDLPQLRDRNTQRALLRCVFGNPFRPVAFDPRWRSESAVALARTALETPNFSLLPILADALEDAGCDHRGLLFHLRGDGPHVRGCWAVDGVIGR